MNKCINVTLTGAAGQIGYALLFRIASGQMFGLNTPVALRLLELEPALGALKGVAMELEDCAFPLLQNIVCTSNVEEAMTGTNLALLVGAVPRKAGMERSDLLKINGSIFTEQGRALNRCAASDVRVFVVGNPCNTNCLIAMHSAPDIPRNRFFAMTMLDELRARYQLASKAQVSVDAITHMGVWGNHSATQYPDFYNALVHGKPALEVIQDEAWVASAIEIVQQRGAQILKARGLSSAASAANAIIEGVAALYGTHNKQDYFSMCKASEGEYGVDRGLIFSYLCKRTEKGEIEVVPNVHFNAYGQEKFETTLNELRQERDAVKALGLIEN